METNKGVIVTCEESEPACIHPMAEVLRRFGRILPALALTLCLSSSAIKAQRWQAGVSMAGANYQGDLRKGIFGPEGWRYAFGASLHRRLGTSFQLDAAFFYGHLGGNDTHGQSPERNLSFHTRLFELSLLGRLNLLNGRDARLVPYLTAGLAGFHIDPFAFDDSGARRQLFPLTTEGQGLVKTSDSRIQSNLNLSIPFGAGFSFRLGRRASLDLEALFRKTFTDYLDDVSGSYPDRKALLDAKGPKAVEMSFRGKGEYPAAGSQRGDPNQKDWYHSIQLRLRLSLGRIEQSPFVRNESARPAIDRDMDGVTDLNDGCPDVPGPVSQMGCPARDTDLDGIEDTKDRCPTVPGMVRHDGCPTPDSDRDGINDDNDRCPVVPGTARYEGCPIPDTDGDGVNDEEDRCRTVAGLPGDGGCPHAEVRQDDIRFHPGTADLLPAAEAELDRLARWLGTANPALRMFIEVHTDNMGKAEENLLLSERRAYAVKARLMEGGISPSRLTPVGYGQSMPTADNKTQEGRAKNRRVVFKVYE